jgi:hypothetical protein
MDFISDLHSQIKRNQEGSISLLTFRLLLRTVYFTQFLENGHDLAIAFQLTLIYKYFEDTLTLRFQPSQTTIFFLKQCVQFSYLLT